MRILTQWLIWIPLVSVYFLRTTKAQIAGPASIQKAAAVTTGSSSSFSLSFSANTIGGDFILVACDYDTSVTPSSVSDSQGNVFTPVGNQLTSSRGARSRDYYAKTIDAQTDRRGVRYSESPHRPFAKWLSAYPVCGLRVLCFAGIERATYFIFDNGRITDLP